MQNNLFFSLILNISFLVLIATILTELRPLRMMLKRQDRSLKNQLVLGVIFGLLSISCTYTGLSFQGAVVNTRVVSTVAAGLVGGPASGICAGVLSGVHRYFYNPAGFTSFACAIGTFLFGVIGAVSYRWFTRRSRRTSDLVFITLVAELVQCGLILLLAKPFSAAAALEESILLPKILVNSLGLVAFMRILDRLNRDLTIELAEQQAVALLIAQGRQHLSAETAETADTQRLKAVLQWLSAHYTEELRVADAAGVCSFSASHFMRWFRQMTGQSFVAFLNEFRLNAAAEALQATDETVLTIASRCGFENLSYFNRTFKAHFGTTPREYRKK